MYGIDDDIVPDGDGVRNDGNYVDTVMVKYLTECVHLVQFGKQMIFPSATNETFQTCAQTRTLCGGKDGTPVRNLWRS